MSQVKNIFMTVYFSRTVQNVVFLGFILIEIEHGVYVQ